MAKTKNDYFKMIEAQTELCVRAAALLQEMMADYSVKVITAKKDKMHEIEQKADELQHDIIKRLSTEFLPPIDSEDILRLVQIIDDVTDAVDEVVLDIYMYCIDKKPTYAEYISKTVGRCVSALHDAAKCLRTFKKPVALRDALVKVNTIEGEADAAYAEALHELFGSENDCKTLIGHKAVYESMEHCCDLCEHAADVIEQIIMKNT